MQRPLLLLDVDGVLQPLGRSLPPGYRRITTETSEVVLQDEHGIWLAELSAHYELVWATTWGPKANALIGARLGLPELRWLDLADLPRDGTRKLRAVQEFVGNRSVAWVDDELYDDAFSWAAARRHPTLLRRTAGGVGLTADDVQALTRFARDLGAAN